MFKKFISTFLATIMVLSTICVSFANDYSELTPNQKSVITKIKQQVEKDREKSQRRSRSPVVAVYAIPGIGEVAILATGAILVGGIVYKAGSWVYEEVTTWIANEKNSQAEEEEAAIMESYENAKSAGERTDNHSDIMYEDSNNGSLEARDQDSYSSQDLYGEDGELKQRRYFDADGNAELDIDFSHSNGDNSHTFPHQHDWNWSVKPPRGEGY